MCLFLVGPSNKIRNLLLNRRDVLQSIYTSNPDGWGAAWGNKRGLKVVKTLPKSVEDVVAQINTYPDDDRELVCHARWATHGDTNYDNCHPYEVVPGKLVMVHNGVLATGNDKDPTRSDTYHFIQDYLKDILSKAPEVVHTEAFKNLVGEFIDNNRFVFMDSDGRASIVNRDQCIEHDGIVFANTYAWSPGLLIKGFRSTLLTYGYGRGSYSWGADDYETWMYERNGKTEDLYSKATREVSTSREVKAHGFDRAGFLSDLTNCLADDVADTLEDYPHQAIRAAMSFLDPIMTKAASQPGALSSIEAKIANHIVAGETAALIGMARQYPQIVAEVMCYYFDWIDPDGTVWNRDDDDEPVTEASADPEEPLDMQALDGSVIRYYLRHRIVVERDSEGWGFVIEDMDSDMVHADINYPDADSAMAVAMRWVTSHAEVAA